MSTFIAEDFAYIRKRMQEIKPEPQPEAKPAEEKKPQNPPPPAWSTMPPEDADDYWDIFGASLA